MNSKEAFNILWDELELYCSKHNDSVIHYWNLLEIIKEDLDKYMQLKEIVTDFINWLDSESTRDWYQYGDIYEHLVYKVDEVI